MKMGQTVSLLSVVFANHQATGEVYYEVSANDFAALRREVDQHHAVKVASSGEHWMELDSIFQQPITIRVNETEPDYDWRL